MVDTDARSGHIRKQIKLLSPKSPSGSRNDKHFHIQ